MATQFCPAPEVAEIAAEIIGDVAQHGPLAHVRVEYVFRDKAPKSKGRIVLGTAQKISGLNAHLADPDPISGMADPSEFFVIVISADTWKRLDEKQRKALVDHELCHCVVGYDDDGRPVLSTRTHDIEEFGSIIDRHGLWTTHLAVAGTAIAEQLVLAVEEVQEFLDNLDDSRKAEDGNDEGDEV